MSVDLAVAAPPFLDLTFAGLEELPGPGQEQYCRDLVWSPGGGAINAVGAARLGLRAAVLTPLGRDWAGELLWAMLEDEGVVLSPEPAERTPVTAVLPVRGERSFATFEPGNRIDPEWVARLQPRAMVVGAEQLDLVPEGTWAYVTYGDREAEAGVLPTAPVRAVLVNEGEALRLAAAAEGQPAANGGPARVEAAALALARHFPTVVVTLGSRGALAAADGQVLHAEGHDVEVVDTTGAGDLFAAAWIWADLAGEDLQARLEWATLYAARSVGALTGVGGALTREELTRAKELS
jgi:sugar/nucleoside kinase (ribokinase family)